MAYLPAALDMGCWIIKMASEGGGPQCCSMMDASSTQHPRPLARHGEGRKIKPTEMINPPSPRCPHPVSRERFTGPVMTLLDTSGHILAPWPDSSAGWQSGLPRYGVVIRCVGGR